MAARRAVLAALGLLAAAKAHAAPDTQVWSELDVSGSPAPGWTITGLAVVRQSDTLYNPTLWGGGAIIDRRIGDLTLSLGDLAVVARSAGSGARRTVNVPLAAVTVGHRFGSWTVSDRNRFEQLRGIPGEPWRYRNRLEIDRDLTGTGPLTSLFVSEEAFYDLTAHQWTRSRAQAGLVLRAARNASVKVYYLRQDDHAGAPRAINALGLTLAVTLAR